MCELILALNTPQVFICHKTQPTVYFPLYLFQFLQIYQVKLSKIHTNEINLENRKKKRKKKKKLYWINLQLNDNFVGSEIWIFYI